MLLMAATTVPGAHAATPADVATYRAGAIQGDAEAQYRLGKLYATGDGVARDAQRARVWLESAADRIPAAGQALAALYATGAFGKPDYKTAFLWYGLAAARGAAVPTPEQRAIAAKLPRPELWALELRLADYLDATPMVQGRDGPVPTGENGSRWVLAAAEAGSPAARLRAARGYHFGKAGFPRDAARALRWYRPGAEAGDVASQGGLGAVLLEGGQAREGLGWVRRAAAAGDPDAMVTLARGYRGGRYGLPRDDRQSLAWYSKAAQKPGGHLRGACAALGEMYDLGKGTPADLAAAKRWFEKAEGLGPNAAPAALADAYDAAAWHYIRAYDGRNAVRWHRLAAELNPEGFNNLAMTLLSGQTFEGREVIPKDVPAGLALYRLGASRGVVSCMANLGFAYRQGTYGPADPAEATKWLLMASKAGEPFSQLTLARMLLNGEGVPRNVPEGLGWLDRSVAQNFAWANVLLGQLCEQGEVVPQDYARAMALYEKAARNRAPSAMKALARLYEVGLGVPQSDMTAYAWYYAANAFERPGPEGLKRLAGRLTPAQRQAALAALEPLFKDEPHLRSFILNRQH